MTVKNVRHSLENIFHSLKQLERPIAGRRRKGVSPEDIFEKFRAVRLVPPTDLIDLYVCADGTETLVGEELDGIQFFPGFYWLKLSEAFEIYRAVSGGGWWSKKWIPIFANGGGDFYAVICDPTSVDFGGVVGFILGETDNLVEFQNVSAMFEIIDRAFSENVFSVKDGRFVADFPALRKLSRQVQIAFVEHDVVL